MDNGSLPPYPPNPQQEHTDPPSPETGGYVPPIAETGYTPPAPETGGYVPPVPETGVDAPPVPETGVDAPPVPQKKKKKLGLILILAAVVLLAAAGAIAFMLLRTPATDINNPLPLLYEKDGEVYLGWDENVVCLGDAHLILYDGKIRLSAMNSFDSTLMTYIADVDPETGLGTLMQVQTDGLSQPEPIAEDVAAARLSQDGTQVLYIIGSMGEEGVSITGTLYHCILGETAQEVAEDVHVEYFDFSPGGGSFYYLTMEGDYSPCKLYTKTGTDQSVKVHLVSQGLYYRKITLGDTGTIYIEVYNSSTNLVDLYRGQGAAAERIGEDAHIVQTFGDVDDLLYSTGDKLYYKAPEEDAILITDSYAGIAFPDYQGSDPCYVPEKHFIFAEEDGDDGVILFEQTIGEDPIKITIADNLSVGIQSGFQWISCFKDGDLCLYQKEGEDWNREANLGENILSCGFNYIDSQTYYYIQSDDEDEDYGDAYCYSLLDDSKTLIRHDIVNLVVAEQIFALQDDNTLYRFTGDDTEKIADDVVQTQKTGHGFYIISGTDKVSIDFYRNGENQPDSIEKDIDSFILAAQSVNYNIPLTEEQIRDLEQLHHDAAILVDFSLGLDRPDLARSLWENILLALDNYPSDNCTREVSDMFMYYFIGFSDIYDYDYNDSATNKYLYKGLSELLYAEELYAAYTSLYG